ncbi:hypothetical protein B1T45_18530 [Mycobacterium kansasii]|uniref:Uncharacterized protein n=1 Tax=Mycobacterium kansasii ATCC 12478 TaxID=557599 RepID=U5WZ09_MYCKA|nr:hypothetical protein MKAN_11015 [Mycobacterium kansasii ATCC 12478]ARG57464.1 hypothetical protein B1T43_18145 [Mycobacterium kansasii]ETZ97755.1 hypothetical protein I547_6735 [Mycobacterium kansasii 824]ARG62967.1 hypothetical protein B1T45_18530 [Mycobacterium kansasii]ARG70587.1 hypothetical protein B1T47_17780 [Mycobacterium kansasii]
MHHVAVHHQWVSPLGRVTRPSRWIDKLSGRANRIDKPFSSFRFEFLTEAAAVRASGLFVGMSTVQVIISL